MSADNRTYDGHTTVFGQDSYSDPSLLDSSICARAVNRSFRGGVNRTRPPFVHRPFIFSDPADEPIVRFGNMQGATFYRKTKAGVADCLVASIAGNIYCFTLVNQSFRVDKIFAGNNPYLMQAWFVQAQDWLYVQNSLDNPIFWNGVLPSSARRSNWPDKVEMPIGTIMQYCFGRVFVADAYDQVAASDIIYGTGFNTTSNTQNFTENTYWQEGGSFGMPLSLGHVTGMIATSAQTRGNLYAQGLLLVTGEDGAYTIDASVDRGTWKDAQVQSIALTGLGCVAPGSLINLNNTTLFRSDDGLSIYQALQADEQQGLSFGKFSQGVNYFFDQDTPWLLQYNSTISFDNRALSTVSPWVAAPSNSAYGNHRYHRGLVALDLDRSAQQFSNTPVAWDGLWTGVRPTVLVNGRFDKVKRAFAFSFDADGENRLYEILKDGLHDSINGVSKQTEWFYLTKRFDWTTAQTSNTFEKKRLIGGELHVSELKERVNIEVGYRSDNRPDWNPLLEPTPVGPALTGFNFTAPRWKRLKFPTPSDKCKVGESSPAASGFQHQAIIVGSGAVRVDRLRLAMAPGGNDPDVSISEKVDDPSLQIGIDGNLENDYAYLIVPASS